MLFYDQLFFLLFLWLNSAQAQMGDQEINILYINEAENYVADEAVELAVQYLNETRSISTNIRKISGIQYNAQTFLKGVCAVYSDMLLEGIPPHVILDTTRRKASSETVRFFSASLSLPTVSGSLGSEGELQHWGKLDISQQKYLLQILPPEYLILDYVHASIRYWNMSGAAIFYDSTFVLDYQEKKLEKGVRYVIYSMKGMTTDQVLKQMKILFGISIKNFFILADYESTIAPILGYIKEIFPDVYSYSLHVISQSNYQKSGFNINNSAFISFAPDINYDSDRMKELQKLYNIEWKQKLTSSFYFDLTMRTIIAVKNMLKSNALPANMTYLTCEEYKGNNSPKRDFDLESYFIQVQESALIGDMLFSKGLNTTFNGYSFMDFEMLVVYFEKVSNLTENHKILSDGLRWKAELGDITVLHPLGNFESVNSYRIVTVEQKPFVYRDNTSSDFGLSGFCIDLLKDLNKMIKFDYTIELVPDGQFGEINDAGIWSGIMGELVGRRADIGLGSMTISADRKHFVDFSEPFYEGVGITVMIKDHRVPHTLFQYLTVLDKGLWICVILTIFLSGFLLSLYDKYSPNSFRNSRENYPADANHPTFSFRDAMWYCLASLSPQGGGEVPMNLSGKIVAATWWLFGFLILASYSANLAAFLTLSRMDTPPESLEDLSHQTNIKYAPIKGSAALRYFEKLHAVDERFFEIWKDMAFDDSMTEIERSKLAVWEYPLGYDFTKLLDAMRDRYRPNTIEQAVRKVLKSRSPKKGFAWVGDATDIRYQVMTNCDVKIIGKEFGHKPYGIAFKTGTSRLREKFNKAIRHLLSIGHMERLKKKWWSDNKERKTCTKVENVEEGISVAHLAGVFLIIAMGIIVACVTLILEFLYYSGIKNMVPKIKQSEQASSRSWSSSEY